MDATNNAPAFSAGAFLRSEAPEYSRSFPELFQAHKNSRSA